MQEWLERLYDEHNELRKKLRKLKMFIASSDFITEPTPHEQDLMKRQVEVMEEYAQILQDRIDSN